MKKILIILFMMLIAVRAEAQVAGWFTNSDVSGTGEPATFYDQLMLGSGTNTVRIKTGSIDPSAVATLGEAGDLYVSTNGSTYQKQDAGVTTNWTQVGEPTVDTVSNTVEFTLSQANSFAFGEGIYHNGSSWVSAQADDVATLAEYVVVSGTANIFTAMKFGKWYEPSHGLTVGEHYFLSATTAGGSSTLEGPNYSSPLFYVEDANIIHAEVYRPSITASTGVASSAVTFELLVGNAADVTAGSANFSSIADALAYATDGNKILLLPRTFNEDVNISSNLIIEGFGSSSVISGTTDFTSGSSGSILMKVRLNGDASIESGVKNVIVTDSFISNTATFTVASETVNSVNIWQEE